MIEARGYAKSFCKVHALKNTRDIKYLRNWVWTIREIMQKPETTKEVSDTWKYFTSSINKTKRKIEIK